MKRNVNDHLDSEKDETAGLSNSITCTVCERTSTLPEMFTPAGPFQRPMCPGCAAKARVNRAKFWYALLGIIALVDLLIRGILFGLADWRPWTVPMVVMAVFLALVLHELGHAAAAWFAGGRVFGIHLGLGTVLARWWWGRFYVGVSQLPISGVCFAGFPTKRLLRLRFLLYVSAGLLFHLIMVVLWFVIGLSGGSVWSLPPIIAWVIVNALLLLTNIWPQSVYTAAGTANSDGRNLWYLITGKLKPEEIHRSYYVLAASFAFLRSDIYDFEETLTEGATAYPDYAPLSNMRASMMLKKGQLAAARELWAELIETDQGEDENKLMTVLNYNNYAWVTLIGDDDPGRLDEAAPYIETAYTMAPWFPFVRGTMATLLVMREEFAAGIEMALGAAEEMRETRNFQWQEMVAINLALVARAYFRQGDLSNAERYLNEALSYDPDDVAVKLAVAEIRKIPS